MNEQSMKIKIQLSAFALQTQWAQLPQTSATTARANLKASPSVFKKEKLFLFILCV